MTALMRRSLATRFVLIVALGAVLPLALVGLWLTRSAERSGRLLLRGQLDHAAAAIATELDRRWTMRDGELRLLAGNTVAQKVVAGETLTARDSLYLIQLVRSLSASIPSVRYVVGDQERWSSTGVAADGRPDGNRSDAAAAGPARTLSVELPVTVGAQPRGKLVARVNVASLLPAAVARTLVPDAILRIVNDRGEDVWGSVDPQVAELPPMDGTPGETANQSGAVAPLRVLVFAPAAAYVQPFEHAARIGLGVLMFVALVALATSIVLTKQATESLRRLAEAATAVAAGDLGRTVDAASDDEIGTVARAFNAMTESLRRTLTDLAGQRALAAVGEFAATLSHEVRNSLTAVRVDLQHARRHLPVESPETKLVGRALDSVRRLDTVVTGALRVARGGSATRRRVSLDAILEAAIRSAEPTFTERGATIGAPRGDRGVAVDGDAGALEQLFLNLLINAAHASPGGSVARVDVETNGSRAIVRVSDAGHGIDQSVGATVGTPFVSTKRDGTGLGLPIARRIVEAHGGELTLQTEPNVGTTATVRLPLSVAVSSSNATTG
jgi:signal transduction histidine kinase